MKDKTKSELVNALRSASDEINILDMGRYDENSHTEFLAVILKHRNGIFLRSFLAEMLDVPEETIFQETYSVSTQVTIATGRRPDLVIESKSLYVVIENKVCCAGDGGGQLHDYWEHAKEKCKVTGQKPYLIYLTLAGGVPSEWSIEPEERKEIEKNGFYHECSYKHNVIAWLANQVIAKCLNSEKSLIASLEVYLEYLTRKTGGFAKKQLSDKLMAILSKHEHIESNPYAYIVAQQRQTACIKANCTDKEYADAELLSRALEIMRRKLVNDDIFLDPSETAYNLKWVLKNNPTLRYKNMGHFDTGAFSSIGQFTYCGLKYVQCATSGKKHEVRIHVPCNAEKLKRGPYVLFDILEYGPTIREDMTHAGFVFDDHAFAVRDFAKRENGPKDLIALAREVEQVINMVGRAVPELSK